MKSKFLSLLLTVAKQKLEQTFQKCPSLFSYLWKWLVGLSVVLTIILPFLVSLSVAPLNYSDSANSFYSSFTITNNTPLITLNNVEIIFIPKEMHIHVKNATNQMKTVIIKATDRTMDFKHINSKSGYKISNPTLNHHNLKPGESYTFSLDSVLYYELREPLSKWSEPSSSNPTLYKADIAFLISFNYYFLPIRLKKYFRFMIHTDKNNLLCWYHVPLE
jgi:hypothetical protein